MDRILNSLISLYSDKLEEDMRTPFLTFSMPGVDGTFGFLGFPLVFWLQVASFLLTQSLLRVLIACIVYKFIIKKRGTATAYLLGYGCIIPFVMVMPFYVIPLLDLRNMCFMVSITSTPLFVIFNCLEAMYGTSPAVVEKDLATYCIYYSSPVPFEIDLKTGEVVKATQKDIATRARAYLVSLMWTTLFFSVLVPTSFAPVPSPRTIGEPISSVFDFLHWGHLLNNYIIASLTCLVIGGGCMGVGLVISIITGLSTMEVMRNPMTHAMSPSDFWGRRWNRMMHAIIKRGVYLPLRTYFSRKTSAIGTFVVSGLLHEYFLTILEIKGTIFPDDPSLNVPYYGMHLAFFSWNGAVMILEYELKDNKTLARISEALPPPVATALVLMTVIPVSHWFTDEYYTSGFYSDISMGFPRIIYTKG